MVASVKVAVAFVSGPVVPVIIPPKPPVGKSNETSSRDGSATVSVIDVGVMTPGSTKPAPNQNWLALPGATAYAMYVLAPSQPTR